ncbi:MAG: AAA family ATPase, partial [Myxococcota bacterium]
MKLHRVELENLNSLYGTHALDFEDDLANAPLFCIVGPTGAGKSTILDAICLALFAQTPRLDRASGSSDTFADRYAHNVMSYGTASCSACVTFSKKRPDGARKRFRAQWSVRRARNNPAGNIQKPVRRLESLGPNGDFEMLVDSDQPKFFEEPFGEVLEGLTVHDFKRSILLAQGQFAAFLRAEDDVKASILERLTNTDDYKRIGQRAAKRRQELQRDLDELEMRLGGLRLLDPEVEASMRADLASFVAVVEAARSARERAQRAIAIITRAHALD